jgi:hypothetical protein
MKPVGSSTMTTRGVILCSLIVPVLISLLLGCLRAFGEDNTGDGLLFVIPALFITWAMGIFIGLFLSVIFKRPRKEPLFYLAGQLVIIITVSSLIYYSLHKSQAAVRIMANKTYNHELIESEFKDRYADTVVSNIKMICLNELENDFKDPQAFRIVSFYTQVLDTTIHEQKDTVYHVFLLYTTLSKIKRISKISVLNKNAHTEVFNGDPSTNIEFTRLLSSLQRTITESKKALKQ